MTVGTTLGPTTLAGIVSQHQILWPQNPTKQTNTETKCRTHSEKQRWLHHEQCFWPEPGHRLDPVPSRNASLTGGSPSHHLITLPLLLTASLQPSCHPLHHLEAFLKMDPAWEPDPSSPVWVCVLLSEDRPWLFRKPMNPALWGKAQWDLHLGFIPQVWFLCLCVLAKSC